MLELRHAFYIATFSFRYLLYIAKSIVAKLGGLSQYRCLIGC